MKVVVQTQHRENYGAHDWNGEGECPQYWKCKGGSTYVVHGVTVAQAQSDEFWNTLWAAVEHSSESFQEFVIHSELVDECDYNVADHCAEWDSPIDLTLVDGAFRATRREDFSYVSDDGIVASEKTWTQVAGRQEDFLLEYIFQDGSRISYRDWVAQQEAA